MSYNREYKSSVFAMLYEDRENVMDLYNGMYDEKCTDPGDIQINTLTDEDGIERGIFAKFKNDLSFIFDSYLNMFEHQSTINHNMPLRLLIYVAKMFSRLVDTRDLYRKNAVKIPSPRFVVFYNGTDEAPAQMELRLSDQYKRDEADPNLELKVTLYNINTDKGSEVLKKSRTLREYMVFVDRTRKALDGLQDQGEKRKALCDVIDQCIADKILVKLFTERREEIIMASILDYDQAAHESALRADGYDNGYETGYGNGYGNGYDSGYDNGYDNGEISTIIRLIGKKIKKGMGIEDIARETETDAGFVQQIAAMAERVSPDYNTDKILTEYLKTKELCK